MDKLTKLENVIIETFNLKNQKKIAALTQDQLDKKTEQIIKKLTPQDLIDHTREIYNRTINRYKTDPHSQEGIVDELILFMNLLKEGDLVLDLGCGSGRDTLFMTTTNPNIRKSLMQRIRNGKRTIEKYSPPEKTLKVVALDSSEEMLRTVWGVIAQKKSTIKNLPILIQGDMHDLRGAWTFCAPPGEYSNSLKTIFNDWQPKRAFHGIWACTSLFVHTPKELIESTVKLWSNCLFIGGKFCLSYINGKTTGRYNKLLRSSSGNIKYFSQPNPDKIRKIAKECGLKELLFRITDFEIKGRLIRKNFFVSHIFEKEKDQKSINDRLFIIPHLLPRLFWW